MLFFRITRLYVCVMISWHICGAKVYGMLDTVVGTSVALLLYFVFFTFVLKQLLLYGNKEKRTISQVIIESKEK